MIKVNMSSLAELHSELLPDPFRSLAGFSPEIERANENLSMNGQSDAQKAKILGDWIQQYQPCLFGRMAAGRFDLLSYCILTEEEFRKGDIYVRNKIQDYRRFWKTEAALGKRSGFIILAHSSVLIQSKPSDELKRFSKKLCKLYLLEDIKDDQVHTDRIFLDTSKLVPSKSIRNDFVEWRVGVNVFAAAADKRWWHDHRIPGGLAFSMNSVGHMVRSGALKNELHSTDPTGCPVRIQGKIGIDSLANALHFAMRTIAGAQDGASGKATQLRKLSKQAQEALPVRCPIQKMPESLVGFDYTTYEGWYDTDATIPASYFCESVERPANVHLQELDFKYIFHDDVENVDHQTTGAGVAVM